MDIKHKLSLDTSYHHLLLFFKYSNPCICIYYLNINSNLALGLNFLFRVTPTGELKTPIV